MTREAIGTAFVILAAVIGRLVWSGGYLSFVKESLAIPLYLSVAVLAVLGVTMLVQDTIAGRAEKQDGADDDPVDGPDHDAVAVADLHTGDHGHDHAGFGPRMGVLLFAPLAVLLLVPAAPLGAFAADNGAANRLADTSFFGDLPEAEGGAVPLELDEVVGRAVLEPDSLDDAVLRTVGFVALDPEQPGTYLLSRFTVGCCAVDAAPYQLVVEPGSAEVPAAEQWVEATLRFAGTSIQDGEEELPVFELVGQELIDQPRVPYIY